MVLARVFHDHYVFHVFHDAYCGNVARRIGANGADAGFRNVVAGLAVANLVALFDD